MVTTAAKTAFRSLARELSGSYDSVSGIMTTGAGAVRARGGRAMLDPQCPSENAITAAIRTLNRDTAMREHRSDNRCRCR